MTPIPLDEYARRHKVKPETVRLAAVAGEPGFYKSGRSWFFSKARLTADLLAKAHKEAVIELASAKEILGPNKRIQGQTRPNAVPSKKRPGNPPATNPALQLEIGGGTGPGTDESGNVPKKGKIYRNRTEPLFGRDHLTVLDNSPGS